MDKTMIKAIETKYKGYRFRSRVEARWAVFFDALKLNWDYEDEGYVLSDGSCYLPDFKIKVRNLYAWVEIKGIQPNEIEIKKMHLLLKEKIAIGYIISGNPGNHSVMEVYGDMPIEYCTDNRPEFFRSIFSSSNSDIYFAVEKAKSARFEFGESA
jgi:predicted nuclease of restriction endonuclease-like RecB superfamily